VATFLGLMVMLPFALLGDVIRLWWRWRAVPLPRKNMTRATAGAFVLVACAVFADHGFPVVGSRLTAGIAAFALLYLVVGLRGAHGAAFDVMSAFWWAALALGGAALLAFGRITGSSL
jgi:predicted Na+-dependent transporter